MNRNSRYTFLPLDSPEIAPKDSAYAYNFSECSSSDSALTPGIVSDQIKNSPADMSYPRKISNTNSSMDQPYGLLYSNGSASTASKDQSFVSNSSIITSPIEPKPLLRKSTPKASQKLSILKFNPKASKKEHGKSDDSHFGEHEDQCLDIQSRRISIDEAEVNAEFDNSPTVSRARTEAQNPDPNTIKPIFHTLLSIAEQPNAEHTTQIDVDGHKNHPEFPIIFRNTSTNDVPEPLVDTIKSAIQMIPTDTNSNVSSNKIQYFGQKLKAYARSWKTYLCSMQDIEPRLEMFRAITLGITLCIASVTLLLLTTKGIVPVDKILMIASSYFVFRILENIIRTQLPQRMAWRKSEDIFDAFEVAGFMLLIFCLKYSIPFSTIFIPGIFTIMDIAYYFKAKTSKPTRILKCMIRTFHIVQSSLILSRLEGESWTLLLIPTWVFVTLNALKTIVFCLSILVQRLFWFFRSWISSGYKDIRSLQEAGAAFWYVLYENFNLVVTTFLFGLCINLDYGEDFSFEKASAIYGIIVSCLIIFFTALASNFIVDCLELFDLVSVMETPEDVEEAESVNHKPNIIIKLEPEPVIKFFLRHSETYYTVLQPDQIYKQNVGALKSTASKEEDAVQNKIDQNIAMSEEHRKEFKIRRFNKSQTYHSPSTTVLPTINSCKDIPPQESSLIFNENKRCLSERNEPETSQGASTIPKENINETANNENLCYICYSGTPNTILLGCGHSGVCFECASTQVEKSAECMECRAIVKGIAEIDLKPMLKNVFKSVRFIKVRRFKIISKAQG